MIRLFVGYDPREAGAYHAFCQSVIEHTSEPVQFIPLHRDMLEGFDGQRDGTNAFILSRYLIPSLCQFSGWAMFCDGDMLCRDDLAKLWRMRNERYAVQVVKHDYLTEHPRKYLGTSLEAANVDYPRKNWSSVMLIFCGHTSNAVLTREFVADSGSVFLHRFQWLGDHEIGSLPEGWNHLVRERPPLPAALAHFTLGVPGFEHYRHDLYGSEWAATFLRMIRLAGEEPRSMLQRIVEDASG